jgi:hypothetical protein
VKQTRHREVGEYLRRLQRSMRDIPAERRQEIITEIEEHIADDLAPLDDPTDSDVRNALERVGDPDDIAAEARERLGIPLGTSSGQGRRKRWLLVGALGLSVLVGGVLVVFLLDGGTDVHHPPEITVAQLDQVNLGDTRQAVSGITGGAGDVGSIVSGLDSSAVEEPHDLGEQQFDDCWLYSVTGAGVGAGSDAALCFDSADQVAYIRVRSVKES